MFSIYRQKECVEAIRMYGYETEKHKTLSLRNQEHTRISNSKYKSLTKVLLRLQETNHRQANHKLQP